MPNPLIPEYSAELDTTSTPPSWLIYRRMPGSGCSTITGYYTNRIAAEKIATTLNRNARYELDVALQNTTS